MHVTRSDSRGSLLLEGIGEIELELLREVRDAADPAACPEAEQRLFPDVINDPIADEEAETVADWKEFVVPDLHLQFEEALNQMEGDLSSAASSKEDSGNTYAIEIPLSHVPQWYSALNQARLVLQEKYRLPAESNPMSVEELIAKGQWRAYIQSRFYAELQCWLLEFGVW